MRSRRHRLLQLLFCLSGILLAAGLVLAFGRQPEPFAAGTESAARWERGPLPVAVYDEIFVDGSRPTQAYGDFAGLPERRLVSRIWYPADGSGAPYPLLVYSHGLLSRLEEAKDIAPYLASHGYVVVASTYPLTSYFAPDGPFVMDVANQPADVSFLIDSLLAQGKEPGHRLAGLIDAGRIGAIGLSLGGMTTTMAAFHPALRDERIGAALAIAGPFAMFTPAFFGAARMPFLMVAGDIDALVPHASNAATVLDKVPGSQLVTIHGASHAGFAPAANIFRWLPNFDALVCKFIPRIVRDGSGKDWDRFLGSQPQGIVQAGVDEICSTGPIPAAMNPLRQQMITAVAVEAFFESRFARDPQSRERAGRFLSDVMPRELGEVSYARR